MPVAGDLVVEDGTGLSTANSYISLADAATYHALRSNTLWADSTESDQVSALVRATDYLDYRWTWVGRRVGTTQRLDWPRLDAIDSEGILWTNQVPPAVKNACAEYALRVLGTGVALVDLSPDPVTDDGGKFITLKREKLGPLEEETRFSDARGVSTIKPYPAADRLLTSAGLVVVGGRSIRA
jgi:hypothetical protein